MRKIKVLFLDVQNNKKPVAMEIEDTIESYYKLIGCDGIDIVRRYISGKPYCIVCDDEGRLKANPKLSVADSMLDAPIAGNVIITGDVCRDEQTSLTDGDIEAIQERVLKWANQYIITQAEVSPKYAKKGDIICPPVEPSDIVCRELTEEDIKKLLGV